MKRTQPRNWITQLNGYIAVPHELLHVAGYWLVGKPCQYRWGDAYVTPEKHLKLWEHLVGLLFPFIICSGLFVISGILSAFAYREVVREESLSGFLFWTSLALVSGGYAGTAIGDLRKAYLLIFNKPWYSWTPFDIFFWPVVDWTEIRNKLKKEEKDEP
jgi:hypothetical protein